MPSESPPSPAASLTIFYFYFLGAVVYNTVKSCIPLDLISALSPHPGGLLPCEKDNIKIAAFPDGFSAVSIKILPAFLGEVGKQVPESLCSARRGTGATVQW